MREMVTFTGKEIIFYCYNMLLHATQWTKHYPLHKYYQTLLSYALNFDLSKPESH